MSDVSTPSAPSESLAPTSASQSGALLQPGSGQAEPGGDLVTEHGRTSIADSVVAKIAGVAAREISGVHAMGGGTTRAIGALREAVTSPNASQGVKVEVGERQAAVDLTLVVEYGASIVDLAEGVRSNVISQTERMTGLEVTEVNIAIDDVYLADELDERPDPPPPAEPRVQ